MRRREPILRASFKSSVLLSVLDPYFKLLYFVYERSPLEPHALHYRGSSRPRASIASATASSALAPTAPTWPIFRPGRGDLP